MLCRLTNKDLNSSFVDNSINPLHRKQLETVFQRVSENPDFPDRVSIQGVKEVGYLFGQEFKMDEWLIIAKESLEEDIGGEYVALEKFVDYVEKIYEEVKIDPYNLIKDLLVNANQGDLVSLDGDVNLHKFK